MLRIEHLSFGSWCMVFVAMTDGAGSQCDKTHFVITRPHRGRSNLSGGYSGELLH